MVRARVAILACLATSLAAPAAAAAVEVHAHRGGTLDEGVPVTPENSMTAFRHAVEIGADVVELDAKLTRDGVPVVMHDATLDRTTDCTGEVRGLSAERLDGCRIDILGTEGRSLPLEGSEEPVPTLAEVVAWASDEGVRLNLEIKNQPTDPDFDARSGFADAVLDAVERSGIRKDRVLVQSFWPPNLDLAQRRGFRTSLLTLRPTNEGGILYGSARLYDVVSPQWPPLDGPLYVSLAHALGKRVVPWTLNDAGAVAGAAAAGADAVITDDPPLAQRVLDGAAG